MRQMEKDDCMIVFIILALMSMCLGLGALDYRAKVDAARIAATKVCR